MDAIAKRILEIIEKSGPIKARDIAIELKIDRRTVNHHLYSDLKQYCVQNESYEWSLKSSGADKQTHETKLNERPQTTKRNKVVKDESQNQVSATEREVEPVKETAVDARGIMAEGVEESLPREVIKDPLQRICRYYTDCVLRDQEEEKLVYAESQWDLDYCDLNEWPTSTISLNDEAKAFIQKTLSSKNVDGYFGYPVLLQYVGKNRLKKLAPVFLWSINEKSGRIDFSVTPTINTALIKHYVRKGSETVVNELLRLEKELGIHEPDDTKPVSEILDLLVSIRQWEWVDTYDTSCLNGKSFSEIDKPGIYNKAIVFSKEKSKYTRGLLNELKDLSGKSLSDCDGSALHDWLTGDFSKAPWVAKDDIIEVLPLNREQKKAVHDSLRQHLTVITGPPGTGKSQVVINLIINEIYNGRSVLFSSKNNKAVDVVLERANACASRPFLVKMGDTAGNEELSSILNKLLSSESVVITLDDKLEADYLRSARLLRRLETEIDECVAQRNLLDNMESDLDGSRWQFKEYFEGTKQIDTKTTEEAWESFIRTEKLTHRENNTFFQRILWNSIQPKRTQTAIDAFNRTGSVLYEIGIKAPTSLEELHGLDIPTITDKLQYHLQTIDQIREYRNLKETIKQAQRLEDIEKEYSDQKDAFIRSSGKYWNAWLQNHRVALDAKDKQTIVEYMNGVKLISRIDDEEVPDSVKKLFKKVQNALPRYVNAQAVTMLSAKGRLPLQKGLFDLLIIDEASQCDIASVIPLLYRAKRTVIIGDSKQLSHISSLSKRLDMELYERYGMDDLSWLYSVSSLFALAQSRADANKVVNLKEHHRSHADIIGYSNEEFYSGDLITATHYESLKLPPKESPGIRWIDIQGEASRPAGGGLRNEKEAYAVIDELNRLSNVGYEGSIGVIAPFRAQANLIRELVSKDSQLYEKLQTINEIEINTVHMFQGDERDIIIFSPTIADGMTDGSSYFLGNNGNLFNVAVSRARAILTVVGDKQTCENCGISYLEHFVDYVDRVSKQPNRADYDVIPTSTYPLVSNMDQVSDWEKVLYQALYAEGIVTYPQYPEDKYLLDLALFSGDRKLDIEVDGARYHMTWDGELCYRDQLRNQRLFELGWDVRRFWVQEVRDDLDWCVDQINMWLNGSQRVE